MTFGALKSVKVEVAGLAAAMRRLTLRVRGLSPEQCRLVEVADYTPFLTDRPLLG